MEVAQSTIDGHWGLDAGVDHENAFNLQYSEAVLLLDAAALSMV